MVLGCICMVRLGSYQNDNNLYTSQKNSNKNNSYSTLTDKGCDEVSPVY